MCVCAHLAPRIDEDRAAISGWDGWDDIVDFADVREFGRCFAQFVAELSGHVEGRLVCIDGKTMRRTFARERGQGPLDLVSGGRRPLG